MYMNTLCVFVRACMCVSLKILTQCFIHSLCLCNILAIKIEGLKSPTFKSTFWPSTCPPSCFFLCYFHPFVSYFFLLSCFLSLIFLFFLSSFFLFSCVLHFSLGLFRLTLYPFPSYLFPFLCCFLPMFV
jgi:hypothetical protein